MGVSGRNSHILQLLREHGYVSVDDLSQALGVSQMTIRRDLKDLEQMGLVNRYHGGASLKPERGDFEWPVLLRETEFLDVKRQIGKVAAGLVKDGDVAILDAGTTTLQVAGNLAQNRLTVASNFLPILNALADKENISLIGIGGNLYTDNQCFIGSLAINTIHSINANIAIMATSCLSLTKGMTNRNLAEAEVKRAMIEAAEKVVLVMDSSKMHRHTLASVGALEALDILVTDDCLAVADRVAIEARGVRVLTVACDAAEAQPEEKSQ
jgi:DeoR family transcriptional regulator, fructose operon transcriptional repressor